MSKRLDKAVNRIAFERRRLDDAQGRIARRNARRSFIGALRSARYLLDLEYPAISKPADPADPLKAAADRLGWRQFEYGQIKNVRLEWDIEVAERFNVFCAKSFGMPAKPVKLSPALVGRVGEHTHDSILLATGWDKQERWRTLLHEIAHYRVVTHGRRFVRELAIVYRLWLDFRQQERIAAKPVGHD